MEDVMKPLSSGNDPALLPEVRKLGWNWAAFLLPYFWLLGHGKPTLGFVLLVSTLIPLSWPVHLFLYPATALYLGFNGFDISWRGQPYHSVDQLREREQEWIVWGVIFNLLLLGGVTLMTFYLRAVADSVMGSLQGFGY